MRFRLGELQIQGGMVVCKHYTLFDACFNDCRKVALQKDIHIARAGIANGTSASSKKQLKSIMQCYMRLLAVYFPIKKRLKVKGIRIDNDDGEQLILSQPEDVQAALASY